MCRAGPGVGAGTANTSADISRLPHLVDTNAHTPASERFPPVPVLEEAPEAKGDELQRGLDHKRGGEEVVAVLQCSLQRLRERERA